MSFGIGIGAFVQGMDRGMQMRDRIDDRRESKANKKALSAIDADARSTYDQKVSSGELQPNQFEKFWVEYALPKRTNQMMMQGDVAGARQLQAWGESDAAREGGRLFGSALFKANSGDAAGALEDAIKAGKIKGYIEHGYELTGQEELTDPSGNVIGFRLNVKDHDGKSYEQDVALGDVGKLVAQFANPEAAYQSQLEAENAKAEEAKGQKKRGEDLEDFETKEQIKARNKTAPAPKYEKDYSAARKTRLENDLEFADMTPEEQDHAVRDDLAKATEYSNDRQGKESAPGIAPQVTGPSMQTTPAPVNPDAPVGPVKTPASAGIIQSPPSGGNRIQVDRATGKPVQQQAPAPAQSSSPQAQQSSPAKDAAREQAIASAIGDLKKGANPVQVRSKLERLGVSSDEYRTRLKAMAKNPVGISP